MTLRCQLLLISGALALCGIQPAAGQTVELFGGYTVLRMKPQNFDHTNMNGWNTSFTAYPTSRLGITADFAGAYATVNPAGAAGSSSVPGIDFRQYSFMGGPQIRVIRRERFESSVRALFGAAYGYIPDPASVLPGVTYGTLEQTKFAALFGGNFDINVSRRVALRFSPGLYLTRFGLDETQKNFRFSVGPVFKFGGS